VPTIPKLGREDPEFVWRSPPSLVVRVKALSFLAIWRSSKPSPGGFPSDVAFKQDMPIKVR